MIKILLFIFAFATSKACVCLNTQKCDEFLITYPLFKNILPQCSFIIQNKLHCICDCHDLSQCSASNFGYPNVQNYFYKSISGQSVTTQHPVIDNNKCDEMSLVLRNQ